jgi:3-(3-hydroxy-phenyl)propionate hydroxylase
MTPSGSETCDVAVVGSGPVGAMLANLLGRSGLRTLVFERDREIYRLPRAVHFDHEVMRIFQSVGLSEEILAQTSPIEAYEFVNGERELLFRFDLGDEVTNQGWKRSYLFHQPTLESCLREAASRRESVSLRLEHEITAVEERADHVELSVHDRHSGAVRLVFARYVVGCDGANSFVRKAAGLVLEDMKFDEPWLVVDATIDAPPAEFGLPTCVLQRCDPARPVTFVPGVGRNIRWEFMLRPGESKQEMLRHERLQELIGAWVDPSRVRIIRTAVYDFHALVARQWNTRRTFIAGDAAHQTPPFLGQGMCAGIRDAANLAWKLDLVLRGNASEEILASYRPERAPHVRTLIDTAVSLGRIICTQDPGVAAARDAELLSGSSRERSIPEMPGLTAGLTLPGCELAGQLGLQARVRRGDDGVLLDDVVGSGFALLARGQQPLLRERAQQVLAEIGGTVVGIDPDFDIDREYAGWLDANACDAVLVRPDHYVFGAAKGEHAASDLLEALGRRLNAA